MLALFGIAAVNVRAKLIDKAHGGALTEASSGLIEQVVDLARRKNAAIAQAAHQCHRHRKCR